MEPITLPDLFELCGECGGKGFIEKRRDPSASRAPGPHLIAEPGPCRKCRGLGGALTPSGKSIAAFIEILRKHGRI
jgi:hypothetical protein